MRKIKKFVAVGMAIVVGLFDGMSISLINDCNYTYAAEKREPREPEDEIDINYNPKYYCMYVFSRHKLKMKCQYGSMWSDLDEGDYLGYALVKCCWMEPKKNVNGKYYAIGCCEVKMEPRTVSGNVSGMSQLADIRIKTINEDSRVCAPTVDAIEAQETSSHSSGGNFTAGAVLKYDSKKASFEAGGSLNCGKTWGVSTSYTYNTSNVSLIQKNNDRHYAHWNFDYISHDGNKEWNRYLFSSSSVAGEVLYRLDAKPTRATREDCCMKKVKCDVRFGAGNTSSGKVADRMGPSTNREMSIKTQDITFSF